MYSHPVLHQCFTCISFKNNSMNSIFWKYVLVDFRQIFIFKFFLTSCKKWSKQYLHFGCNISRWINVSNGKYFLAVLAPKFELRDTYFIRNECYNYYLVVVATVLGLFAVTWGHHVSSTSSWHFSSVHSGPASGPGQTLCMYSNPSSDYETSKFYSIFQFTVDLKFSIPDLKGLKTLSSRIYHLVAYILLNSELFTSVSDSKF